MIIGIVGAPNKGKSTLFSAITMAEAEIANYPFTTIKPNYGVAYVSRKCVDRELGVRCNAMNSVCIDGTRLIPINTIDVAGLVPGAHLGRGMGNQFLNDLAEADAFIIVVDASSKTDMNGNACERCDPSAEVKMVVDEVVEWLAGIIKRHMNAMAKREDGGAAIAEVLTGLRLGAGNIERAAEESALSLSRIAWDDDETRTFARRLLMLSKPFVVAANKADLVGENEIKKLAESLKGYEVVACSAAIELALRKAAKAGVINYVPGSRDFEMIGSASEEQKRALGYMKGYIAKNGTGANELFTKLVFDVLKMVVVYPVEDENKFTDHFGNVLPDAILVRNGTTAVGLAERVHTDLAKSMLYAVDARKRTRLSKDYVIRDNDVIRIVSAAKH